MLGMLIEKEPGLIVMRSVVKDYPLIKAKQLVAVTATKHGRPTLRYCQVWTRQQVRDDWQLIMEIPLAQVMRVWNRPPSKHDALLSEGVDG